MLNKALKLVRVFHRINQTDLAKKLNISRSYLSEIESGKKVPSIEILKRYSNIFSIPASSLMLFSEKLEDNSFSEKSRVMISKKILNIMNWLTESEWNENNHSAKEK